MRQAMQSSINKRSIVIGGHKTSVSLEDDFWLALKDIAAHLKRTLSDLVGEIDSRRNHENLSSAIRLFVLAHFRNVLSARLGPAVTSSKTNLSQGVPTLNDA